jgi:YfiH family protein
MSALQIPFTYYTCAEQKHGTQVVVVNKDLRGKGREEYASSIKDADALIVREKNILIAIHLADCVPLVVYDREKHIGALIHSGWKGTAQQITIKTINYMIENMGCSGENMIAGIGPSISDCCFQIGSDTADKLQSGFTYSPGVITRRKDSLYADLKQANREQLLWSGLKTENIEIAPICTSCENDKFHSYRAESGKTGRFSTYLMLL